jgi:hypothetical protein
VGVRPRVEFSFLSSHLASSLACLGSWGVAGGSPTEVGFPFSPLPLENGSLSLSGRCNAMDGDGFVLVAGVALLWHTAG